MCVGYVASVMAGLSDKTLTSMASSVHALHSVNTGNERVKE